MFPIIFLCRTLNPFWGFSICPGSQLRIYTMWGCLHRDIINWHVVVLEKIFDHFLYTLYFYVELLTPLGIPAYVQGSRLEQFRVCLRMLAYLYLKLYQCRFWCLSSFWDPSIGPGALFKPSNIFNVNNV